MRFLPFINGKSFLVLYAIYAIVAIILLSKKINNNDSEYFVASSLDEEKYYVLKNKYSLQNMFYYITYKLYAKGIILKDENSLALAAIIIFVILTVVMLIVLIIGFVWLKTRLYKRMKFEFTSLKGT
jgi:hypothetical protein